MAALRTQLQLLERYWTHRVLANTHQGDAREAVLRDAVLRMTQERTLRVERAQLLVYGAALDDVLRSGILAEWQINPNAAPERYVLVFSHNILFDYAAARLLLRTSTESVIGLLSQTPDLAIVVRPSFSFHFQYLWDEPGRQRFWELLFAVMSAERLPETSRLIGPTVVADRARDILDLDPLVRALRAQDQREAAAAERALRHVCGALLASPNPQERLVGATAGPWAALLERVTR